MFPKSFIDVKVLTEIEKQLSIECIEMYKPYI